MPDVMPVFLLTLLLLMVATSIIVLVLIYQKKQLQYLNEKAQLQVKFEKEILESRLEIQEQTMKNVSQEVHDNIGQLLSIVKLNMNLITGEEPKLLLQEKISDTTELVGKAIRDLRDLSKSLNSDSVAAKGLVKSIEFEFSRLKKSGAFATHFHIDGDSYNLPDNTELILFRIFQEAVNNTIKHGDAASIDVRFEFNPHVFLLVIKDDGKGFNLHEIDHANGMGLRNIKNRSRLMGANCTFESEPGKGTEIKIELPV